MKSVLFIKVGHLFIKGLEGSLFFREVLAHLTELLLILLSDTRALLGLQSYCLDGDLGQELMDSIDQLEPIFGLVVAVLLFLNEVHAHVSEQINGGVLLILILLDFLTEPLQTLDEHLHLLLLIFYLCFFGYLLFKLADHHFDIGAS